MPTEAPSSRFLARCYPIIDPAGVPARSHLDLARAALGAGAPLIQLRFKNGPTSEFLRIARAVQALSASAGARLIINDRADIAAAVGAAGVHLGQSDLPPDEARRLLGTRAIIGWSTHNAAQVEEAECAGVADYLGFGPIFPTESKDNPDPVQGLEGLHAARALTRLPIVAIGGINAQNAAAVLSAGADAVAVISAIARAADPAAATKALLRL